MKKLMAVLLALALVITAIPMVIAGAEDNGTVVINADGRQFTAKTGDTFDYIYYLNIGERLCSLQGDFFYAADGLEPIFPENEDDLTFEMIFPKLWSAVVLKEAEKGHIVYNYSNVNGMKFVTDTSRLIRAQFKVTATSGELGITNILHTVAGENERTFRYIDQDIEPISYIGSNVPALTPVDVAPETLPATEATEVTEPATQTATVEETIPPTQPATVEETIPETQPPTVPLTEAPTEMLTEPPTESPTAAPTEKPTEIQTELPTEPPTEEPTVPDKPMPERKYGDVDDDGDITIVDTSFIQRHLAGIDVFDAVQLKYGDVDDDGDVTIVDGTYIQRWLAGIVKDNPLERFGYPRS